MAEMDFFGERKRDVQQRAFEIEVLGLLRLIAHRLEITMADIDTLNSEVAQVAADESSIAGAIKIVLDELAAQQAGNTPVDLSGPIAALQALHTKLQSDDASLVAAEPPAPASAPATSTTAPSGDTTAPASTAGTSTAPAGDIQGTVTVEPVVDTPPTPPAA